jgi:predicted nicotinamide N-methyase
MLSIGWSWWVALYMLGIMVQGKLFLIQSHDPRASSTIRWRPLFSNTPSFETFLEALADYLDLAQESRDSLTIEVYDSVQGCFTQVLESTVLNEVLSNVKPTQMIVKYTLHTDHRVPMIRGRAFDTSSGLIMKTARGEYPIHIQEPGQAHLGTGLNTWDGSLVLAKYLEKHESIIMNKKVLELGAGTGIAGMAAALLGAKFTLLTDLDYVLPNLVSNVIGSMPSFVDIIDTSDRMETKLIMDNDHNYIAVQKCDWKDKLSYPQELGPWDVILGADIVWLESLVPALVNTLVQCAHDNTTIIISHQVSINSVSFLSSRRTNMSTLGIERHEVVTQMSYCIAN